MHRTANDNAANVGSARDLINQKMTEHTINCKGSSDYVKKVDFDGRHLACYTVPTRPNQVETAVHGSDLALSVLVVLVSQSQELFDIVRSDLAVY